MLRSFKPIDEDSISSGTSMLKCTVTTRLWLSLEDYYNKGNYLYTETSGWNNNYIIEPAVYNKTDIHQLLLIIEQALNRELYERNLSR